jgi:Zn-dependent M28 family amino/carboxypeptidase
VAVMVELAEMAAVAPPVLPIVFVAFGAEEPRGDGDARHHYGSRHYVDRLSAAERAAIRGMISLDGVGVGTRVRVRTGGRAALTVADRIAAVAARLGMRIARGTNRASDHWSFEKAGIAAAYVGGQPFAGYHSPRDRPDVISTGQLARTGRLVWSTLAAWR